MSSSKTTRVSRLALTLAPAGLLGVLATPGAQAASGMPLGSFETYKPAPFAGSGPWGVAAGPDGAMWITELQGNAIGRIAMDGRVAQFPIPTPGANPFDVAAGPDGAMWFTEWNGNKIGRITMDGAITEYPVLTANAIPHDIALGPDGAMWFTESAGNRVGRITMNGTAN